MLDCDVRTAVRLILAGADWRTGDDDGNTALHWAAMLRRPTLLVRLLDAGVDVSVRNSTAVTDGVVLGDEGGSPQPVAAP